MAEEDEDKRIEEKLARRERAEAQRSAQESAGSPAPGRQSGNGPRPAPSAPDVEALFGRLKGEIDGMEGRVTAAIDAVAEGVAPVQQAADQLGEWTREARARGEAVDRIAPLLEQVLDRERRIHRPARRRARAVLFAIALAVAVLATLVVQWQFAVLGTADPTNGWRGHVWERYGRELQDCVIRAERQGRAMLCPVFDPEPASP